MEKKLFADLVTSLKEAAAISRGKVRPSRQFNIEAPKSEQSAHQSDFTTAKSSK